MKKIFSFILCLCFVFMPAYAEIIDEFATQNLDKNLKVTSVKQIEIRDDFAEQTLNKNSKIKPVSYNRIEDSFAESNKAEVKTSTKPKVDLQEIIPKIGNKKIYKKVILTNFDKAAEIPVKIKKYYTTRSKMDEGDFLEFETVKDLTLHKKFYPAGSTVMARIETISLNKAWGVPSDLIVGNFSIDNIPLYGEINKVGANRSLWVYPCTYGFLFFFGAGLLFIPIRGGHAKITRNQIYTLYAE